MDLAATQRRVRELAEQKSKLDGLDTSGLSRVAASAYEEVYKILSDGISADWYVQIAGPVAQIASEYIQESRHKAAFEKLTFAKGWLESAQSSQSEAMKRIALKQSFSDSAYALQLFTEELSKGGTAEVVVNKAKQVINDEIASAQRAAVVAAIIAGFFLIFAGQNANRS